MEHFSQLKDWDAPPLSDEELQVENSHDSEKDAICGALLASGWSLVDAERMINDHYGNEEKPRFEVTDAESCNWVLRKMAECQDELVTINAQLQEELARLVLKVERLSMPIKKRLEFFNSTYKEQIEEFAQAEALRTKKKTVKLLFGEVKITTGSKSLEWVGNEPEIRPLLEKYYPEAVQTVITHTLLKTPVKNALLKGEFDGYVDGVQVAIINTGDDKIEIKPCLP